MAFAETLQGSRIWGYPRRIPHLYNFPSPGKYCYPPSTLAIIAASSTPRSRDVTRAANSHEFKINCRNLYKTLSLHHLSHWGLRAP